jgi:hypothetical protein
MIAYLLLNLASSKLIYLMQPMLLFSDTIPSLACFVLLYLFGLQASNGDLSTGLTKISISDITVLV